MFQKQSQKDKLLNKISKELLELKSTVTASVKPKTKETNYTIPQKLLILHYTGVLSLFKKAKTRYIILSTVFGCHDQSIKEVVINDYDTVKTSENLKLMLSYFKLHKMQEQILAVNNDIEILDKRLKNKLLTKK